MDCLDAKQMLEPCAKGQLSAADKAILDRHVATCEGCRLELELTRAVLGSSSSQDAADDPALVDPVLMEAESDPASFDTLEEPSIEQERLPQTGPGGHGPPRVLTSQLPEESEEDLDLASIQPSAYDPGAIHLPHTDQTFEPAAAGERASEGAISDDAASSEENVSFDDLPTDSPALPTLPPAASGAHDASKSGTGGKIWDFEPVDMPRTSSPPEESLTFAKEALDRQRGNASRGKRQARLLLWIGGALGGVGLLGASVWMALAFREPAGSPEPSNVPALQPPPGSTPFPPGSSDSLAPSTEPTPGVTASDSSASPPRPTSVIKAGATAGVTGTGAIVPQVANPKQSVPKQAPIKSADGVRPGTSLPGATAATTNPDGSTQSGKPSASPAPAGTPFRDDELAPAPRREPQILKVEPDAKPGDAGYGEEAEPVASPPPKVVITAPIFVPPSSGTSSAPGSGTNAGTESGTGPLDRLHMATVTAAKNQDLETLRKIKTTWKSMTRSSTGQDRSRSKREYADCLWAIQEITKRDADRKEALAAYREYVLHAPAGGADARTVSRMRHLEDMLSDAQ